MSAQPLLLKLSEGPDSEVNSNQGLILKRSPWSSFGKYELMKSPLPT